MKNLVVKFLKWNILNVRLCIVQQMRGTICYGYSNIWEAFELRYDQSSSQLAIRALKLMGTLS